MKRSVSFIVDPRAPIMGAGKGVYTFWSAMSRMKECMESIGCEMPDTRYSVTYTLAPKTGRLRVKGGTCNPTIRFIEPNEPKGDGKHWDAAIVCQLPVEWIGQRINRRVRLLARKEVADAGLQTTKVQGVWETSQSS